MDKKKFKKYFIVITAIILAVISFIIIKPFINAILAALIASYIFYPLHKKLSEKINKHVSATIITIILLLIIILPLMFVANTIVRESILIYRSSALENINDFVLKYIGQDLALNEYISGTIKTAVTRLSTSASQIIFSIPGKILDFVIFMFVTFYSLLKAETYIKKIKERIPLPDKNVFLKRIGDGIYNVIYGLLILAIIELVISAIGFKIIGLSSPLLWAMMIAFLVFIPLMGPALVWVPFTIIKFLQGNYPQTIGIIIIGVILSIIDTLIRPAIIGSRAKIHPVVVLLGALGGLKVFGIIGLIAGPIILDISSLFFKIYIIKKDGIKS